MRILFINKNFRIIGTVICILLVGLILVSAIGCLFDFKYVSVFTAKAEIDKYEIRSRLLMDAMNFVGVCYPEKAATIWADGLKQRNAAMQYSVMNKELKMKYTKQLDKTFPNWVTGVSSPWVESFRIVKTEKLDDKKIIFHLNFITKTSTGPAGDYNAVLTVSKEDDYWKIIKIVMDPELYVYTGFDPSLN